MKEPFEFACVWGAILVVGGAIAGVVGFVLNALVG